MTNHSSKQHQLAYHKAANRILRAAGLADQISHRCVQMWYVCQVPLSGILEAAQEVI